jgi:hypothetical protein
MRTGAAGQNTAPILTTSTDWRLPTMASDDLADYDTCDDAIIALAERCYGMWLHARQKLRAQPRQIRRMLQDHVRGWREITWLL